MTSGSIAVTKDQICELIRAKNRHQQAVLSTAV